MKEMLAWKLHHLIALREGVHTTRTAIGLGGEECGQAVWFGVGCEARGEYSSGYRELEEVLTSSCESDPGDGSELLRGGRILFGLVGMDVEILTRANVAQHLHLPSTSVSIH